MEFDNIQLPPFVIAGLYRHSLVLLENKEAENKLLITNDIQTLDVVPTAKIEGNKKVIETSNLIAEDKAGNVENKPIAATQKMSVENTTTTTIPQPIIAIPSQLKYLGGYGKKISVVVAEHFQPHISDVDLAFLSKLLQACRLSINDVAIINVVSNASLSTKLWQLMPAEKMIMFDVDPGTIGLPFRSPNFKVQPWNDCLFLTAPSLQEFQDGPADKLLLLKRKLWDSLKKLFEL